MADLYAVLGVDPAATTDEIRAAWRARARTTHPDLGGDPEAFRVAREAADELSDPDRRAAYDATRRAAARPAAEPDATDVRFEDLDDVVVEDPFAAPTAGAAAYTPSTVEIDDDWLDTSRVRRTPPATRGGRALRGLALAVARRREPLAAAGLAGLAGWALYLVSNGPVVPPEFLWVGGGVATTTANLAGAPAVVAGIAGITLLVLALPAALRRWWSPPPALNKVRSVALVLTGLAAWATVLTAPAVIALNVVALAAVVAAAVSIAVLFLRGATRRV